MKQKQIQQIQYIQQERFQQAKKAVLSANRHNKGLEHFLKRQYISVLKKFLSRKKTTMKLRLRVILRIFTMKTGLLKSRQEALSGFVKSWQSF